MSEYQYLRSMMTSGWPLSNYGGLDFEDHGAVIVFWVRNTRAKKPACITVAKGHRPLAPSASLYLFDKNATYQLFEAGVDDSDMPENGTFIDLWIEPQGRSLRV